jgi:CheY-like chemotaxis protein
MAKLIVISKAPAGLSYSLGKHWITIGRSPGNIFQIPESSVSGQHCEVLWRDNELAVRDMRSTNGTFINDCMISEGVLKPGEVLRLGEVELRLEMSDVNGAGDGPANGENGHGASTVRDNGNHVGRRHQVLLVDDSMAFLEMAGDVFETFSNGAWEVHRACGADEALGIMQQRQIELAVLDINMPVLDGLQLLTMLHRRHPDVKKVVLTAMPNETHRGPCLAAGAELFLEKPITRDGLRFVYNVLNDSITWKQREGFSGTLQQVGLVDIIQIECLRRNSCILEIHTGHLQGQIYIESGVIVHAAAGALSGEKALHRLLSLNDGQFNLYPYRQPTERTVHGSWEWLIMESARVRDEERGEKDADGDETAIISRPSAETKALKPAEVTWGLETGAD